jgi:hypothetical protein
MKLLFALVISLALTAPAWATDCFTTCNGGAGSSTAAGCYTTCR